MNARQLWQAVLTDLETRISRGAFANWFRQTGLAGVEDDVAVVTAPHSYAASTLEDRYATQIERALSNIVGRPIRATFAVARREGATPEPLETVETRASTRRPQARRAVEPVVDGLVRNRQLELTPQSENGLNPRLTFDSYIVGSSNRLAHAAAEAVAELPGGKFNPLFVHGGVGLGKTHLMHAIGHEALARDPNLTIRYVTSETFTNDVINDIRSSRMDDFRARYRAVDILMIDDIQFIAGKESTQEEFFHTFNTLYQNGKQIIISSDKPPRAISALEDRMRSRFEGGLIADVQSPDYEMRIVILQQKAEESGVRLPNDVTEYIAGKDQTNIRELEGALNKILMLAQLYQKPLTLSLAMEALTDSSISARRSRATANDVIDAVTRYYNVTEQDLRGRQRKRDIVLPRQVAMYILRAESDASLVDIGRSLGNRDHTTVIHGIEKIEHELERDVQLRAQIMAIRESLLTGSRP
ncbi:MAG TPA: chromosomal replication initiator protein DnaA [Thermomicrobiales bacterium]|nr:chromosomal replication initiator protein DnaA [Thermomicrobiales bacterium]